MKPLKVLGGITDECQPKEPMYVIAPVTNSGDHVMHGKNHTDYVDC